MNVEGTTFFSVLSQLADADPDRPALTCGEVTWTRAGFVERVARLAALFAGRGVVEGSTVTIGLPNSTGLVESVFAAWALGAVPQPVSDRLPPLERSAIVDLASPSLVVGVPQSEAGAWPVLESVPRQLPAGSFTPGVSPAWKLLTSGGSTGRPKLIAATAPALFENVSGLGALTRMRSNGCVLVTGPISHNAPFVVATVGMLLGNHVVVMSRFDPAQTLSLIETHRVSWLFLVPTMMVRTWRLPEAVRLTADVSSLEVAFHMAAPCPAWLKQAWIDWLGPEKVLELYGGTELQAMTVITGTEWLNHRGSVGRPVIGEIQIRDFDGRPFRPVKMGRSGCAVGRGHRPRTSTLAPARAAPRTAGSHWAEKIDRMPATRRQPVRGTGDWATEYANATSRGANVRVGTERHRGPEQRLRSKTGTASQSHRSLDSAYAQTDTLHPPAALRIKLNRNQ